MLQQVLGLDVDVQLAGLGVLGEVEGGDLGHVLILAFSLLFLQLERDTADGTTLDALHQMCDISGDLISQTTARDDGDLVDHALVGVEVEAETGVEPLLHHRLGRRRRLPRHSTYNYALGGLLDRLRSNATHLEELLLELWAG